jgi:hypothetical protein
VSTVADLADLSLEELRARWRTELGASPPKLRTRELLSLALAYRLQARVQGDLGGPARRRLAEFQRRFAKDRNYSPALPASLRPGAAVVKEWRGVRHEVWVLEEGFSYRGQPFGSLSEVAEYISGVKRSGFVFFGLKAPGR